MRDGAFPSPLRSERTAALLGVALGVSFLTCFLTGKTVHSFAHALERISLVAGSIFQLYTGLANLAHWYPWQFSCARVVDDARSAAYRLTVGGRVARPLSLTRAELLALPQHSADLPTACVEGWSAGAVWTACASAT